MPDFASLLYGAAEKQATDPTLTNEVLHQDFAQQLHSGAQLALEHEKVGIERQKLQMQMQQLQTAKTEKFFNFLGGSKNISNPAELKAYLNAATGFKNTLGIKDISDDAIQSLGVGDRMQRMYTLQTRYLNGEISAADAIDLGTNPMKADQFAQIPPTPVEMMGQRPDLTKAQEDVLKRETELKTARIRANAATDINKVIPDFSKQVQQDMGKITTEKTAIASALDARDRIAQSLKKDPSGQSANPVDMGAMIYSLLHSELGRVNHTELENQLKIPGIENMSKDQIVKYLGGVNPNVFQMLNQRLSTAAKNIDAEASAKDASLEAQIKAHTNLNDSEKDSLRAIKKPYTNPVYRPDPGNLQIGGHEMTPAQVKLFLQKHPDSPLAPEMQKFLGGP